MNRTARQLSIVGALLLLFGGAFMLRYFSNQKAPPARKPAPEKIVREVQTFPVSNQNITSDLDIQGRLVAFEKMQIFAEVSGRLLETARPFKVGSYFRKGDVLLKIDDSEARLALLSQKANLMNAITNLLPDLQLDYPESLPQWRAYLDQYKVESPIKAFPDPVNDKEKFFISARNLHTQYYNIKSQEERLSKYIVRAPFGGVLTAVSITPGSLVRSGQPVGELMNNGNYELEATIRLADLAYIKSGSAVSLYSTELDGQWNGRVKRISDQIDPNTQTVIAYIGVTGRGLREGMYLAGKVKGKTIPNAMEIPKTLLVNQDQVLLVENNS
ncbi:MAG: HlyD family efflux transporter periplasmic adaptor subunit, partial [Bacteroidota bacterium]